MQLTRTSPHLRFAFILFALVCVTVAQLFAGIVARPAIAQPADSASPPASSQPNDQGTGGSDLGNTATLPEQFSACAAAGGGIDVLILVDESGSLKQSDPENARVTSGLHLVSRMSRLSQTGNLSVAVSGFGHAYNKVRDWQDVKSDGDIDALRGAINELANRTDGVDTDYWTAMDEARKQLADKARDRGGETKSCQAIIWFSDGELDYEVRTGGMAAQYGDSKPFAPDVKLTSDDGAQKAEDLAREDICRPGGLADQLRSSKVAMFGVGLGTQDGKQFDLMRSIATGKDTAGNTCGDLTEPVPGEFFLASDIDSLLFAFDSISGLGQKPISSEHGVCVSDFCEEEAHTFVLDPTTRDVDGFATVSSEGLRAAIQGPDGKVVELKQGAKDEQVTINSVPVTYTWETGRSLSFRLDGAGTGEIGDDGPWVGVWRLAFIANEGQDTQARSKSNLHITPGIVPAWPDKDSTEVRAGTTLSDVKFVLKDRAGNDVPASKITSTGDFEAVFTDSSGAQQTLTETTNLQDIGNPITWDLTGVPTGAGTLGLSLELTTADAQDSEGKTVKGTKLSPASVAIPVNVQAPLDYPTVPTKVDFGEAKGAIDLTSTMQLGGKGCAWIESGSTQVVASPQGLDDIQVTSGASGQDSCIKAGDDLNVTLQSNKQGNGAINGTFTVVSVSETGQGEPIKTNVEFTASAVKPLNTFNFVTTLLIALLLGPGIPLLILYAVKWMGAKIPSQPLVAVRAPLERTSTGVTRDGERFAFQQGDMRNTVMLGANGSRRIDAAGITLKTKLGGSPLGPGHVVVSEPNLASVSKYAPGRQPARLPLAVHNHWLLFRPADGPADRAEILVLLAGNIDEKQRDKLADEIAHEAGDLMDRLPSNAHANQPSQDNGPFGSPSEPQPNPFSSAQGPAGAQAPHGQPGPRSNSFPVSPHPGAGQGPNQPSPNQPGNPFGQPGPGQGPNQPSPNQPGNPFGQPGPGPNQPGNPFGQPGPGQGSTGPGPNQQGPNQPGNPFGQPGPTGPGPNQQGPNQPNPNQQGPNQPGNPFNPFGQ